MALDKYLELKNIEIDKDYYEVINLFREAYSEVDHAKIIGSLYIILLFRKLKNRESVEEDIETNISDETLKGYLRECFKNITGHILKETQGYSDDMVKAMILFPRPIKFTDENYSTPVGVSQLVMELLDINEDDTVMDLGSGINDFLLQTTIYKSPQALYGIEINPNNYIVGKIRGLILGIDIQTETGNFLSQDFKRINANKVFSNPPLGQRWGNLANYIKSIPEVDRYFKRTKRTITGEWAFALSAIHNTERPGKTIVIMSNAGTWNKADEIIRRRLIEEGMIEGVIVLPERLFASTYLSLTIIIFSENNRDVLMVDGSKIFTQGRSLNTLEPKDIQKIVEAYGQESEISKRVPIKDIEKNEYILNPFRYLEGDMEIKDGIPLGEIIKSINRGSMIRRQELDKIATTEETPYQHLMLSNINEGIIDKDLPYLKEIDEKDERYCIRDNNLIISKISPFKIALASIDNDKKILATGNLYMVEIDETKANPIYIELFLQSELGISQLNKYSKGAAMKSISIRDLKKIQIPNIPLNRQNEIAKEATLLAEQLEILESQIDMIKDKRDKLVQEVV